MGRIDFDAMLEETFSDRKFSRSERKVLSQLISEESSDREFLNHLRNEAFSIVKHALPDTKSREALEWLEGIVKMLENDHMKAGAEVFHACFTPGDSCRRKLMSLIDQSEKTIDICVFTITDDRVTSKIFEAHKRGVTIRIISDDQKMLDRGSDIINLAREDIPVVTDNSEEAHMHHKFAVFDQKLLATGSYNWTRSACFQNENLLVTDEKHIVATYHKEFEKLWEEFSAQKV